MEFLKQLQQCVQERTATKCVDLHLQEKARVNSNGPSAVTAYQRRAQKILREEHAFKICIVCFYFYVYVICWNFVSFSKYGYSLFSLVVKSVK